MDKQSSFLTREEEFCFSFAFEVWVTLLGLIKIVGHKIYVYISSVWVGLVDAKWLH